MPDVRCWKYTLGKVRKGDPRRRRMRSKVTVSTTNMFVHFRWAFVSVEFTLRITNCVSHFEDSVRSQLCIADYWEVLGEFLANYWQVRSKFVAPAFKDPQIVDTIFIFV